MLDVGVKVEFDRSNTFAEQRIQDLLCYENASGIQNDLELISELNLHGKLTGQVYSKCVRRVAMIFEVQPVFFNSGDFHPRGLDHLPIEQSWKRGLQRAPVSRIRLPYLHIYLVVDPTILHRRGKSDLHLGFLHLLNHQDIAAKK